jgi:hypothetical protein
MKLSQGILLRLEEWHIQSRVKEREIYVWGPTGHDPERLC